MYGTLAMITFQSLAHTTTTPTAASHTAPVRVLPVYIACVVKSYYNHTLEVDLSFMIVYKCAEFHNRGRTEICKDK